MDQGFYGLGMSDGASSNGQLYAALRAFGVANPRGEARRLGNGVQRV
jgi:hypothetical protein